jgi:AraC-like DNA-binding protein
MYSRVCQFNTAFQQLNHYHFIKYSDIAYDNGFADQSHFIRVFKEFTNLTPSDYLQKTKALSIEI